VPNLAAEDAGRIKKTSVAIYNSQAHRENWYDGHIAWLPGKKTMPLCIVQNMQFFGT
jgi:hypothetical protein